MSKVPDTSRNLIVSPIVPEGNVTSISLLEVSQKYDLPASAVKSFDLLSHTPATDFGKRAALSVPASMLAAFIEATSKVP